MDLGRSTGVRSADVGAIGAGLVAALCVSLCPVYAHGSSAVTRPAAVTATEAPASAAAADPADSSTWRADPNRTRYLYVPSAMFLRPGEAYVSQKQLLLTTAAVGVTDWLNVLAGSVLPGFLLGRDGANFMVAAKVGTSIGELLHLNCGGELLYTPGEDGGLQPGFVFIGATVGSLNNHISLTVGRPSGFYRDNLFRFDAGAAIVVLSASLRVSDNVALLTENWMFPTTKLPIQTMANAMAARFVGDGWSLDAGVVRFLGYEHPLPWIDVTFPFTISALRRGGDRAP